MKPRPRNCDSPAIQLLSYAVTMRIASNLQPVARGDSEGADEPPPHTHTRSMKSVRVLPLFCARTHMNVRVHTGACNIRRQVSQDHWWRQYGNSCVSLQHFSSTKIQLYNECTMKRPGERGQMDDKQCLQLVLDSYWYRLNDSAYWPLKTVFFMLCMENR